MWRGKCSGKTIPARERKKEEEEDEEEEKEEEELNFETIKLRRKHRNKSA